MTVTVIVGAQFGDEAKGKITDYLAANARYVVRTGGGPNAGHSIHLEEGSVVLHQLACGVLRKDVVGISGPGMVINPFTIQDEIAELESKHLLKGEYVLSERAHALLPLHQTEDAWEEEVRSAGLPEGGFGTTRRGIGPAYADRYGRWGIRLADLLRPKLLAERLTLLYATKSHLKDLVPQEQLAAQLEAAGRKLAPHIRATEPILWPAVESGENILLEGAQSALLDIDFGTYPYVTSSHPTSAGAMVGSGIPPQELDEVIGVTKAYCTRVGAGPFPTQVRGEMEAYLQREGGERGATTGRPRQCGWLDMVLLRYVTRLNGFTSLALTKVDVLGGLEEVPVCVQYVMPNGETLTHYPPAVADELSAAQPVYQKFPAWPEFTSRLKDRIRREGVHALPPALHRLIQFLQAETGVPVEYLSYGAQRDETVWLGRGAASTKGHGLSSWTT
ncbi:MAG: adenylosuccinate synthase [Thermoplasmata archaeon]